MQQSLPVDPAKDLGVVRVGIAEGDPVGPVLGQPVLFRHSFQPGSADGHLHQDVGLLGARVVLPQGCERLVSAAVTWERKNRRTLKVVSTVST